MKTERVRVERNGASSNGAAAQHRRVPRAAHGNSGRGGAAADQYSDIVAAWINQSSRHKPEAKLAIAQYAATHLINYGDVIQVASGTTLNALMDKIIERQYEKSEGLDLIILTSNLQVLTRANEAQGKDQRIFGTMQIILTGGALQPSLHSLIGEFAAEGIKTELIHPRTTFFGASGLSFQEGLTIRYQFEEEVSTQVAYANRPTGRRVLLCDHTKFGKKTGWKAPLTLESLLSGTDTCLVISTIPEGDDEEDVQARKIIPQEEEQLRALLRGLLRGKDAMDKYADKEFALRFIDSDGSVRKEVALSEIRQEEMSRARRKSRPRPASVK